MAECNNGHEKITFEGAFSALCPLCRVIQEHKEETRIEIANLQATADEQQGELESLQAQLDQVSQEYAEYRKAHP